MSELDRSTSEEIPFYPPKTRRCPFAPPDIATQARAKPGLQPIRIWSGKPVWLVTRYDDVRAVLGDPRFSADWQKKGFPHHSPASESLMGGLFLRKDGEYHMKIRRMLLPEFTVRYAEQLRPRIEAVVDEQIALMRRLGPPVDLIEHLALVVPTRAICIILGVPYEDRQLFQRTVSIIVRYDSTPEEQREAMRRLDAYMLELTSRKTTERESGDLLSRIAHGPLARGEIGLEELARVASVLVLAGHETTANQIGLSILGFLHFPDQLRAMRETGNVRAAVEEMLRFWSINQYAPRRVATEDVVIGGQLIRAGEGVIVSLPAANRDPLRFGDGDNDPEKLIVTRESRQQIAFGYGPHQCLGQNLARMEMRVVFERLFDQMPTLRLAVPIESLRFNTDQHIFGVRTLPVTW